MYTTITSQSHRHCARSHKSKKIIKITQEGGGDVGGGGGAAYTDITSAVPQFMCACKTISIRAHVYVCVSIRVYAAVFY